MITIISPAKSIEMVKGEFIEAAFQSQANLIVGEIAKIRKEELQKQLKLSDKLLEQVLTNNEKFSNEEYE
ncbi:MAG: peroxide stress protein YaaA, partial [Lentisphaeria bacterium]